MEAVSTPPTLFEGLDTFEVAYTYGQIWTDSATLLHDGLDCVAPAGTLVLALEAGTFRQVPADSFGNSGALVVESMEAPGEGWLYEHVLPLADPLAPGDVVQRGQAIGTVAPAFVGAYPHVHLERVSTTAAKCGDSLEDPYPALRDPLEHAEVRALIDDHEPPAFLPIEDDVQLTSADPVDWIALHDDQGERVEIADAFDTDLQVVCRVSDRNRANGLEVAPLAVSLSIDGPGAEDVDFEGLRFDGPVFEKCYSGEIAGIVYSMGAPTSRSSFDERKLYFVPTARLVTEGDRVTGQSSSWHPSVPGDYTLTFRSRDRSGNEATKQITLALGT